MPAPDAEFEMEALIIILVIGWGLYQYNKFNTRNGAETVRAYLFLKMIDSGFSREEARNRTHDIVVSNLDTRIIRDAMAYVKEAQGGMQFPLIRTAYAQGMTSRLPAWYRSIIQV